jgi:CRP-like cAMP-binding protein
LQPNEPADQAFLVVSGVLRAAVPGTGDQFWMERLDAGQMFVVQEMLQAAPSPVRLVAESDAGVLAIPAARLASLLDTHRPAARDLAAMIEARRRSVAALARGIRVAA